jgi:4-oxalocrotonate tautomerase
MVTQPFADGCLLNIPLFRWLYKVEYRLAHYPRRSDIMPGLSLLISGEPKPDLVPVLARELTELTCAVLDKQQQSTTVLVDFLPRAQWFIHNCSLAELGKDAFRLQVTVTDETTTKDQKARFQREAYALLAERIGNLHSHSNVHLIDCRAGTYSYAGVTQEYRYQHPQA